MAFLTKKMPKNEHNSEEEKLARQENGERRKRRGNKIVQEIRTKRGGLITKRLNPKKAIEYFCKECMGWKYEEVLNCKDKNCSLYGFRLGKNDEQEQV